AYTGHMIDKPGRSEPRFPLEVEATVRQRIEAALDQLEARIAYGSAACGADLLFAEALLARGAEVHIVLPFAKEDFLRESVSHGGPGWERRFREVIDRAGSSVTYATGEAYLKTAKLFRFADQLVRSLAYLRADSMGTSPTL